MEIIERAFALGRECAEGWLEQARTWRELPSEPTEDDLRWALDDLRWEFGTLERSAEFLSAFDDGFAERMSEVEDEED